MPAHELPGAIHRAWRPCQHRLILEVSLEVGCQIRRGTIPSRPILLQRLHRYPVQFATQMPFQRLRFLLALGGRVLRGTRSEEHTSELQSRENLVCRLLLEKKIVNKITNSLSA